MKNKKKRTKKMSSKTMARQIDIQKTLMVQRYLTHLKSSIDKVENNGTIKIMRDLFNEVWIHKLRKCVAINSISDSVERLSVVWSTVNDLIHDQTMIDGINDVLKLAYEKSGPESPRFDTVNTNRLRVSVGRTTRRISFNLVYDNYLIEISYILNMGVSSEDLDRITSELWDGLVDGVAIKAYNELEFKVEPVTRFGLNIKELSGDEKSRVKQGVVAKHTPITNKVVMTYIHDEDASRIATMSKRR